MTERVPADLTRVQELVYELKIEQVMTKNVITVTPDCTIRDLKEILRVKRISGAPVVQGDELVGIVSIENLIRALEKGELMVTVGEKMTTRVQTVRSDESVVSAVQLFARQGYGRYPVVDERGKLVGMLTQGDVVRGLLRQMEVQWHQEEIQRYRASHIFEDIESDQTGLILRYYVKAKDFVRGGEASSKIKRALERLGGNPRVVRRVAVATYEAETNVIIHSYGGEIIAEIRPESMRITATDTGPGIEDVTQAMQPGFSTAPDWIRELGFGAGMGLSNIKACADSMKLDSQVGVGTRLELIFKLQ
jgi:CBS domain-containing protein/anti-sigma regulatory factor (Ser/Thr protein kinase)